MRAARLVALAFALAPCGSAQLVLEPPPGQGPCKHVVLLAGDEEYRSEEALPMLAQILARRHGFRCTVLLSLAADGTIDPDNQRSLGTPDALDSADLIVMALRFRSWPDDVMARFVAAYERGVPIVALRTSTHAFAYPRDSQSPYRRFSWDSAEWPGGFGRQVLGETWVSHWGEHKVEGTRGVVEPGAASSPLLRGVGDVFGDTDVYGASPPADASVLLRGQVVRGLTPDAPPVAGRKNDPMQPIAWTRLHRNAAGLSNRVFCTTMGAATDLRSEGLRRLLVNAVHWGLGLEVPQNADVTPVTPYLPTAYGFGGARKGVRPSDHAPPAEGPVPLTLPPSARVALLGGGLAVRLGRDGYLETLLHARHPRHRLVVRGFGWPADEVGLHQRPEDYTKIDDPLAVFAPDTLLLCYGANEAFAGEAGIPRFVKAYERWLAELEQRCTRDGRPPRLVLVTPAAERDPGDPLLPDAGRRHARLAAYGAAIAALAARRGLLCVDLLAPARQPAAATPSPVPSRSSMLEDSRAVAERLAHALLGGQTRDLDSPPLQRLLAEVQDKAWLHEQDYRMVNGWYVYGGRRTYDTETFPLEYRKLRAMVAVRDQRIWTLAQGERVEPVPDDRATGELLVPQTGFGTHAYSEPAEPRYPTAEAAARAMRPLPGLRVEVFASEERFPELANPVQLTFDERGRLWVACMPTYPQWRPGDPRPNDRLLIFEDDDHDGRADRVKTFYEGLHCPTGFELWNGGVLAVDQPRLLFLRDTDGDDRADVVQPILDGFATDDTHHSIGAFEWSPGGLLTMLEGVHVSTTVETPWGPVRSRGPSGAWILDPQRLRLGRYETPGYGNPWCATFDAWGNGIVGDGTGATHHDTSLLAGAPIEGRRGPKAMFDHQGMRPVCGTEILASRHLPDDLQGQMVSACVINMHGLTRFSRREDGGSFTGERLPDLLATADATFRPVDPQIGPDGALWVGDWCNLLIGHMQYSQRDPLRDHGHGRIYRIVAEGRPLLAPVLQHGLGPAELLAQLREPELRTRYRARRALRARPREEVLAAVADFVKGLDAADPEHDRLLCEALWAQQAWHAVDAGLLRRVLACGTPQARAAAVRVAGDERDLLADAAALLWPMAEDPHPRVRLEAIRALGFFQDERSVAAVLAAAEAPRDPWLDYVLDATLRAQAPLWQPRLAQGQAIAGAGPEGVKLLAQISGTAPALALAQHWLAGSQDRQATPERRQAARGELARLPGDAARGKEVFARTCIACHRVGDLGISYGPDLNDAGKRLTPIELVESILEPSARIDPAYALVVLETAGGDLYSGFVVAEDAEHVTLRMAGGTEQRLAKAQIRKREARAVSPMTEGFGATLAATEVVDLVRYLETLR